MTATTPKIDQDDSTTQFFCVGSNHRTADIGTREEFFLTPEQIQHAITATISKFGVPELAIVSTCNRCEVFGVSSGGSPLSKDHLRDIYSFIHDSAKSPLKIETKNLKNSVYTLFGVDAIRHAFLVASSLDSLVPGETQITGQFKDALALARASNSLGPMLGRLSQEALATAKKVRSNTDIGRHRVSISHAAIDLARRASNDLSQLRFLIIGAGEMSRVAAEYAASYKPQALTIANRTRQKAFELTQHVGFGDAHGLDTLHQLIAKTDVVICATSSPDFVVTRDIIKKSSRLRESGPLFLIDIALPRNIDPSVSDLDDIYLFDIDDLKSVVEAHMGKRLDAVREATEIVTASVEGFSKWLAHQEVAPIIKSASDYFAGILHRESLKTFSRDVLSNLTPKQREALEAMLAAVQSRLTGDVAHILKNAPDYETSGLANALHHLFNKDNRHD